MTHPELPSSETRPLDAARSYRARGLYPIPLCIPVADGHCNTPWHNRDGKPCPKPGKIPTAKEWGALEPDDAKLCEWFARHPRNIGLALRGMAAFDLDSADGERELERAAEVLGPLPPTWENTSGRGRHLIYRFPDGADDTGIKGSLASLTLRDGVFVTTKRGVAEGDTSTGLDLRAGSRRRSSGQIAVAPSLHANGRHYVTRDNDLDAPAVLPLAWFNALPRDGAPTVVRTQPERATAASSATASQGRGGNNRTRFKAVLVKVLANACDVIEHAPDGAQNNTINAESLRVFRLAIGAGEDLEGVALRLLEASVRGGHPERAAEATIRSARSAAESQGAPALPERARPEQPRAARASERRGSREGEGNQAKADVDDGTDVEEGATGKPVVMCGPDLARAAREALVHLATHPRVYQRSRVGLVYIERAPELPQDTPERTRAMQPPPHTPVAVPLARATLKGWLTDVVEFRRIDKRAKCGSRWCSPPDDVVAFLHAAPELGGVRPLAGIVEAPTLRPDGTILTTPGYDAATGLSLEWQGEPLDVPELPTREDARAAYQRLCDPWTEFMYQGERGVMLAAVVAAVMTPLARAAIRGPVPMFMFEADVPNAGKTLAVNAVGLVVTGRAPAARQYTDDDDETAKRLGAVAMAGAPLVFFDNVRGHIEGGALEAVLTAHDTIAARVLGTSTDKELPWRATVYATANGVTYSRDISRRVVHILMRGRTTATVAGESPGARERTYRYPDLPAHVADRRRALLRDALTILRAHVVAGRPRKASTLDTFEQWSRIVADAVCWASDCDPILARPPEHTDRATDTARRVVLAWSAAVGVEALTLREVLGRCLGADPNAPGARGPAKTEALADLRVALADLCNVADLARVSNVALGKRLQHEVLGRAFAVKGGGFVSIDIDGEVRGSKRYACATPQTTPSPRASGGGEGVEGVSTTQRYEIAERGKVDGPHARAHVREAWEA